MLHWLQHGDHGDSSGGRSSKTGPSMPIRNVNDSALVAPLVVALIDPDEMFLRPMTTTVGRATNLRVSSPVKAKDLFENWPVVAEGR